MLRGYPATCPDPAAQGSTESERWREEGEGGTRSLRPVVAMEGLLLLVTSLKLLKASDIFPWLVNATLDPSLLMIVQEELKEGEGEARNDGVWRGAEWMKREQL